ncbi:MAG: hypothetical protein KJ833_10785, partial [Alphaproteobacteria bacterium]|nr:hypothetical protein [Alphaproteobacteria bacterium]
FVALADVDPDADLSGFPSILNLFSAQTDHVTEMSDWDKAYLAASTLPSSMLRAEPCNTMRSPHGLPTTSWID